MSPSLLDVNPILDVHRYKSSDATTRVISLPYQRCISSTLVQGALALVLAKYACSTEIHIGIKPATQQNPNFNGNQRVPIQNPCIFPIQVQIDVSEKVAQYLAKVLYEVERAKDCADLHELASTVVDKNSEATYKNFQAILIEHCCVGNGARVSLNHDHNHAHSQSLRLSNLDIHYYIVDNQANLVAQFNPEVSSTAEIDALFDVLEHVLQQLSDNNTVPSLSLIDYVPPSHMETIMSWNCAMPAAADCSVQDLILRHVISQPDSPAIRSWDGDFTYYEIDILSTQLANYLAKLSVGPDVFVACCFDKSAWAIVSMLAIIKSGGAFVPVGPTHPDTRIRSILQAAKISVVLTSPAHCHLFASLGVKTVKIDEAFVHSLPQQCEDHEMTLCSPRLTDAVYMISTSGSTGVPKNIIVDHGALSTAISGLALASNMSTKSRCLQFAAYTFDPSIHDIFTTLCYGGCVCVPSEHERLNDLAGSICRMEVNTAVITPSIAELLRPDDVPCLKHVAVGGEAFQQQTLDTWADSVGLWNHYGPSECVIACAAIGGLQKGGQLNNIGKGLRALLWITDPEDHHRLCPLGSIGELLIEGPVLARGYTDPDLTCVAFIYDPIWAKLAPGQHRRFYKTGDLVKYNMDGTIVFIGRKDSQIKISGQRVELGEIEHHLSDSDLVKSAVVHFPSDGIYHHQLVAVITLDDLYDPVGSSSQIKPLDSSAKDVAAGKVQIIRESLSAVLPIYMVPQAWVVVKSIPLNTSGKLDRSTVKRFLAEQSNILNSPGYEAATSQNTKRAPSTDTEKKLQKLWSDVLGIPLADISVDENFFERGGNSLQAMRLVAIAQRIDMGITVADIFSEPVLKNMASHLDTTKECSISDDQNQQSIIPFELVGGVAAARNIVATERQLLNIAWELIEDIYPCTPLQAGLISLSAKSPGTYTKQIVFELSTDLDIVKFKEAWEVCFRDVSILRSVIIPSEQYGPCQIILKSGLNWQTADNLESFIIEDSKSYITYGIPLNRFTLIQGNQYFVWTTHHASYDGVSLPLILERVEQVYKGASPQASNSILKLVRHIQSTDLEESGAFWKSYLAGAVANRFPQVSSAIYESLPDKGSRVTVPLSRKSRSTITTPTIIRAAWALVLSRYSESSTVVCGATLSGRTAPVRGIDEMIGPTLTTVPVQIKIDRGEAVFSYLERVQAESSAMMPFEHTGLRRIASLGPDCRTACDFQNLLVIQPSDMDGDMRLLSLKRVAIQSSPLQETQTYPLNVEVELSGHLLNVKVTYDSKLMTEAQISRILGHFSHMIQQLALESESKIGDIEQISPQDLEEIQGWNSQMPDALATTIPEQFLGCVKRHPEAPAVCAWDGELTYNELELASSQLAQLLVGKGAGSGVIIPMCFDKSVWAVVATLSIVRAGAAYVALDPAHPQSRLFGIIQDVQASIIISAPQHADKFSSLGVDVVAFGPDFLESSKRVHDNPIPRVKPTDAAFVVFTSGSTGKPKGIVIEHQAICTSTNAYGSKWGIGYGTRTFQFAAHVFDVSVSDFFASLTRGACVCIPSEHDRMNDTAAAINRLRANYVSMTPTVASLMKPEDVPGLKTLVLGGEAPTLDNIRVWAEKLNLIICYGPAECSVSCSGAEPANVNSDPSNIGTALGSLMWIVEPTDHNQLVPIGCVGEILIEGPILARGYLHDHEKTSAAFIENPTFIQHFASNGPRRFYKTGDLGYYRPEHGGSINFMGRKDTQVKVRGQRVELGEIEHHIYANPHVQHAVVTVPITGPLKGRLVAMLTLDGDVATSAGADDSTTNGTTPPKDGHSSRKFVMQTRLSPEQIAAYISDISDYLMEKVPRYMVPTTFIFVEGIPLNTSGKLDRQEVKTWIQSIDDETYQHISGATETETPDTPLTMAEELLREVCSHVLKLDIEQVRMGQSFLALGGDSITAMLVVTRCRAAGMHIRVKEILQSKTLHQLASLLTPDETPSATNAQEQEPRDTISNGLDVPAGPLYDELLHKVKARVGLQSIAEIEAIYPCTPVQIGMLITHARDHRFYEIHNVFEVKSMRSGLVVDPDRLERAWNDVVNRQPVLRTVFFEDTSTPNIIYQAVINGRNFNANVLRLNCATDDPVDMLFSKQTVDFQAPVAPNRLTICSTPSGKVFAKVEILHALSDGTTWDMIFKEVSQAYEDSLSTKSPPSYADYVSYLASQPSQKALKYWESYLAGVKPCLFPRLSNSKALDSEVLSMSVDFDEGARLRKFCAEYGVTVSNIIQAVWALVLRSYLKSNDLCFGYVVSGRDVPLPAIEEAVGTYIGQLPCHVHIDNTSSYIDIAKGLQEDYFSGISNQHVSFVELYHSLGITGQLFNTNVHVTRVANLGVHEFSNLSFEYKRSTDPSEYDITIHALVSDTDIRLHLGYWSSVLSESEAKCLAELTTHTLTNMLDNADGMVGVQNLDIEDAYIPSLPTNQITQNGDARNDISTELAGKEPTPCEDTLIKIWVELLEIDAHRIGLDARFRRLGGDSYLTMKMMIAIRKAGFFLNLSDALSDMTLLEMAARMESVRVTSDSLTPSLAYETCHSSENGVDSTPGDHSLSDTTDSTELSHQKTPYGFLLKLSNADFPVINYIQHHPVEETECMPLDVEVWRWDEVEDLLPTTLVQREMLASQTRSEDFYKPKAIYQITGSLSSVDMTRLATSWQQIVNSHQILRTIFVRDTAQPDRGYKQLVLKDVKARVEFLHANNEENALAMLIGRSVLNCRGLQPAHELAMCQTADGDVLCSLSISHALSDAVSLSIILKEFSLRCNGRYPLIPKGHHYSTLQNHVSKRSRCEAAQYWKEYLNGAQACHFPTSSLLLGQLNRFSVRFERTSELRQFARHSGLTAPTIFRSAWALLLSTWLNMTDVCFGHVVSGRNEPIPDIENIVGPFINILPCRVKTDPQVPVLEFLENVQANLFQSLPYQFWSSVHAEDTTISRSALFNTLFNYRNKGLMSSGDPTETDFKLLWSIDPMDYEIVLAINDRGDILEIELSYWNGRLPDSTIRQVAQQFSNIVCDILDKGKV
ncbi:hypothetical protein BX600DRAFT_532785 [Xylariales sp. PMI_506]|nr:hypothetical protein BX600DRAFT_532785 [Xylariales sp. PMI_506]